MDGYVKSPMFAWAGWRLRVPGGPVGGQYHGYLANENVSGPIPLEASDVNPFAGLGGDSRSGWSELWHGVALREGETASDYVYRSSAEVQPRANASGGVNTVRALQTVRTAGFAEAPGNYAHVGGMGRERIIPRGFRGLGVRMISDDSGAVNVVRTFPVKGGPVIPSVPGDGTVMHPVDTVCPAWGCGINPPRFLGPPVQAPPSEPFVHPQLCSMIAFPACPPGTVRADSGPPCYTPSGPCLPGATSVVPQPPPPQTPVVSPVTASGDCRAGYYRDAAGNCTNDWRNPYSLYLPPVGPAPTVPVDGSAFLPSQGQVVPGITPSTSGIMDWLSASSIWSAVPNGVLLAGAAFAVFAMSGRRK